MVVKQIGDDIHLFRNVDRPYGNLQIDDQLEYEFGFLLEGKGACAPLPVYVGDDRSFPRTLGL